MVSGRAGRLLWAASNLRRFGRARGTQRDHQQPGHSRAGTGCQDLRRCERVGVVDHFGWKSARIVNHGPDGAGKRHRLDRLVLFASATISVDVITSLSSQGFSIRSAASRKSLLRCTDLGVVVSVRVAVTMPALAARDCLDRSPVLFRQCYHLR